MSEETSESGKVAPEGSLIRQLNSPDPSQLEGGTPIPLGRLPASLPDFGLGW